MSRYQYCYVLFIAQNVEVVSTSHDCPVLSTVIFIWISKFKIREFKSAMLFNHNKILKAINKTRLNIMILYKGPYFFRFNTFDTI